MIVDLNDFRPKNESYEHYLLKQIGRAYLLQNNIRVIGCEVPLSGFDRSPFGEKRIADVVGVDKRTKQDNAARGIYNKIQAEALILAAGSNVVETGFGGRLMWVNHYRLQGDRKIAVEREIEYFFERACERLGYPKYIHTQLQHPYKNFYECRSVESKATLSDFHNGFCVTAEYSYVISPIGMIPKKEIPSKVGLLEFDFEKFEQTRKWQEALVVTKKPKKEYDSKFFEDSPNRRGFKEDEHGRFCEKLIFTIGQQNTEETVNWSPFIKLLDEGYSSPAYNRISFKYNIGDETPLGIVIDRRIGKNPDADKNQSFMSWRERETEFYKFVRIGNQKITPWITLKKVEESFR